MELFKNEGYDKLKKKQIKQHLIHSGGLNDQSGDEEGSS